MAQPYGMFGLGASVGSGPRERANVDPLLEALRRAGVELTTTTEPHFKQLARQLEQERVDAFKEQGPPYTAPLTADRARLPASVGGVGKALEEEPAPLTVDKARLPASIGGVDKSVEKEEEERFIPLLERLAPSLYKPATEDITGTIYPTVESEKSVPTKPRPDRLSADEFQAGGVPLVGEDEIQEEFDRLPYSDYPSELAEKGIRGTPRTAGIGNLPEGAVDQPDEAALPEADLNVSLLDRLGRMAQRGGGAIAGFAKDNPEVAAQIAQAAGGLMSNIAGGRARREAGEETDRRVARANIIGALTGGRARPQVTAAQADEGGLLSRLGQITTAGGEIASGEMARRRAEGLQERELAAKELNAQSQADYRKAMANIGERQLDVDAQKNYSKFVTDYMKTVQAQAKASRLPVAQLTEMGSSFATLKKLDDLENFIVDADFSALEMGPLSLDEPSEFIFGSDATVARSKIQGLIAEIAKTVPGVLTEQDQKRLEQRLLTLNNRESTAVDLADAFREGMIEEIQSKMDSFEKGGGYNVDYFRGELDDYTKGRGTEGFISKLTQDELDLGY